MVFAAFLVSILTSPSHAKGECTVDSMTNQCRAFSAAAPAKIEFGDGTYLSNLAAAGAGAKVDSDDAKVAGLRTQLDLEKQVRLAQLLDRIPATRLSERFKQSLLKSPETIGAIFLKDPIVEKVRLVWPANDESATYKDVPLPDVKRASIFTAAELTELRAISGDAGIIVAGDPIPIAAETSKAMAARLVRLAELIKFARESIISIIQNGHSLSSLSAEERAMIDKVNAIQFMDPQSAEIRTEPSCKGEIGNAFYRADRHMFTICPSMLHYPDATLVAVIAHEFTHAIDSCRSQGTLYEIHRDKLPLNTPADASPGVKRLLAEWRNRDSRYPLFNVSGNEMVEIGAMPGDLESLRQLGVLSVKAPGVPFNKYPFGDAYRCLTTGSNAFAAVRDSDIKRFASDVSRIHGQQGESKEKTDLERKIVREVLGTNKQCWRTAANDQMTEVMSDWVGAQVEGLFLERNPIRSEKDRLAPAGFFAMNACLAREREQTDRAKDTTPGAIIQRASRSFSDRDPHAAELRRYNDIFLAEPRTRRALNCSETARSACFESHAGAGAKPGGASRAGTVR